MTAKKPSRIVYVRHPQCLHNVAPEDAKRAGIENRRSPLTSLGKQQCEITARYLEQTFGSFDAVFCSTYDRTRAIPVGAGLDSHMVESPLLDERSMGIWHTFPRQRVIAEYPEEEGWREVQGLYYYKAPGGESCIDVETRLRLFSESLRSTHRETILISGHGIAGLCMRKVLTEASVSEWHSWQKLMNASVTVYELRGERYTCVSYNVVPWQDKVDAHTLFPGTEA